MVVLIRNWRISILHSEEGFILRLERKPCDFVKCDERGDELYLNITHVENLYIQTKQHTNERDRRCSRVCNYAVIIRN